MDPLDLLEGALRLSGRHVRRAIGWIVLVAFMAWPSGGQSVFRWVAEHRAEQVQRQLAPLMTPSTPPSSGLAPATPVGEDGAKSVPRPRVRP